jgi:hypothetical protein
MKVHRIYPYTWVWSYCSSREASGFPGLVNTGQYHACNRSDPLPRTANWGTCLSDSANIRLNQQWPRSAPLINRSLK